MQHHDPSPAQPKFNVKYQALLPQPKPWEYYATAQRASCDQPLNKISLGQQRFCSFELKADKLGQKSQKKSRKLHSDVAFIIYCIYIVL